MVKLRFPDGSEKEYKKGITGMEIAKEISEKLMKEAICISLEGKLIDLTTPITTDGNFKILTFKDKEGIEVFRHSTAHVLAEAVIEMYPNAKPTIGPAVDEGFYYDFEMESLTPEDMEKIEERIKIIIGRNDKFEKNEVTKEEALKLFKNNKFKTEMINELPKNEKITIYKCGKFLDLCRGPHVHSTGMIKAVKLTKISGSYWRGDSTKESLQRIYGISFNDPKELKKYLEFLEEAKKRDHKKIGKELDLYSFHDEGPGFPFWHPKGTIIYNKLVEFAREENTKRGYNEIRTPTILNQNLWKTSGHWDNFRENMYFTKIDNNEYAVKPMNCPGGLLIYNSRLHSYRELPLRNAEFGYVHRHELSGVLNGLFRVRAFTQDDAHSFCEQEQIETEIIDMIEYAIKIYSTLGFKEYDIFVATKPLKSVGSDADWERATENLKSALQKKKLPFKIKAGEGAFYGPKIEFNIKDAIGRNWQCGTIQVDFSMPARFKAEYDAKDGTKKTPVMIHRAILGSVERFLGVVIENFAGKLPLWLSPVQIKVLTVADRNAEYAEKIKEAMINAGLRVEIDNKHETINKKVLDAQMQKVNYMITVGDKEEEKKKIAVRTRDGEVKFDVDLDRFILNLKEEVEKKEIK